MCISSSSETEEQTARDDLSLRWYLQKDLLGYIFHDCSREDFDWILGKIS